MLQSRCTRSARWLFERTVAALQRDERTPLRRPALARQRVLRILNGYVYISPTSITDEATLAPPDGALSRYAAATTTSTGNELYDNWVERSRPTTGTLVCSRYPRYRSTRTRQS